jgi:hypothetical protein
MNTPGDFSVQAHMPKACEAKRAETKKEEKAPAAGAKE